VIERAVLLATDGTIKARDLPLQGSDQLGDADGEILPLAEMERRHIGRALDRTQWHQGKAATMLGISPKTLYRKIREFGFSRPEG
jgi:transcriptional regulator of acetoin/glycerol metabolism